MKRRKTYGKHSSNVRRPKARRASKNGKLNKKKVAIVLGITLIATVVVSKIIGCTLPLLAKRLKLDPAIMAAPLITTVVDVCSILVYFQVATHIMGL